METEIKRDSAGRFLKGSLPNPIGRPKTDKTIRNLARVHTKDALKTLSEIVKKKKQVIQRECRQQMLF